MTPGEHHRHRSRAAARALVRSSEGRAYTCMGSSHPPTLERPPPGPRGAAPPPLPPTPCSWDWVHNLCTPDTLNTTLFTLLCRGSKAESLLRCGGQQRGRGGGTAGGPEQGAAAATLAVPRAHASLEVTAPSLSSPTPLLAQVPRPVARKGPCGLQSCSGLHAPHHPRPNQPVRLPAQVAGGRGPPGKARCAAAPEQLPG